LSFPLDRMEEEHQKRRELLSQTKELLNHQFPPPPSQPNSRLHSPRERLPQQIAPKLQIPVPPAGDKHPQITPRDAGNLPPSCPGSALSMASMEPWDGAPPSFSVPVTPLSTEKPRSPSAEVGAELTKVSERVGWGPSVSFSTRRGVHQRSRGVADELSLPRRAANAGKSHVQDLFSNDENIGANCSSRGHPVSRLRHGGRRMPLASKTWG